MIRNFYWTIGSILWVSYVLVDLVASVMRLYCVSFDYHELIMIYSTHFHPLISFLEAIPSEPVALQLLCLTFNQFTSRANARCACELSKDHLVHTLLLDGWMVGRSYLVKFS